MKWALCCMSEFMSQSQISRLSTSCVQMHDSHRTIWVKNKKQTGWLNSVLLIQMVSTPSARETATAVPASVTVQLQRAYAEAGFWVSAEVCAQGSALQHLLVKGSNFYIQRLDWDEMKLSECGKRIVPLFAKFPLLIYFTTVVCIGQREVPWSTVLRVMGLNLTREERGMIAV